MQSKTNFCRRFIAVIFSSLALMPAMANAQAVLYYVDGDNVGAFDFDTTSVNGSLIAQIGATGVAAGPHGNVYVGTDSSAPGFGDGPGVVEFNGTTGAMVGAGAFVPYTGNADSVINPQGMRFGPNGNLYIADVTNSEVHIYSSTGTSLGTLTGANIDQPVDVAFDSGGNLYASNGEGIGVSLGANQPFVDFVSAGTAAGIGMNIPKGLAFGPDGKLYVADEQSDKIFLFNADGSYNSVFANLDDAVGGAFVPSSLAFGPGGDLYVSGLDLSDSQGAIIGFHDGVFDGLLVSGLGNPGALAFTPNAIPEPSTWMLPAAFAALVWTGRRRKLAKA